MRRQGVTNMFSLYILRVYVTMLFPFWKILLRCPTDTLATTSARTITAVWSFCPLHQSRVYWITFGTILPQEVSSMSGNGTHTLKHILPLKAHREVNSIRAEISHGISFNFPHYPLVKHFSRIISHFLLAMVHRCHLYDNSQISAWPDRNG